MEHSTITQNLVQFYLQGYPEEAADILNEISADEIIHYLDNLPPDNACKILLFINTDISTIIIKSMDNELFLKLFSFIDIYKGALLLSRLREDLLEDKLSILPEKISNEIRILLDYPAESAGFIMDTRITTFRADDSAIEVLEKIRKLGDRKIMNIYVLDESGKLLGIVPLQIVAISPPDEVLKNLLEPITSVHAMSPSDEVVNILKDRKIFSLPVVDMENHLLGIIRYDALIKAAQYDATEDVQAIFGAGREEKALSRVSFAIRKRLPWLQINLATAFLAASVVGLFEDTIARITVLAVFLPVVAGQSGNTGSQALAVTIRGLALREIRISQWWKVARKEVAVGFFNGVVVAFTTAVIVYFWASSLGLALVIGVSMVSSMVLAGFSGAVIPIILKSLGQDPAQSSSIVLTTVTDIVGFMSFLGLATVLQTVLGIV